MEKLEWSALEYEDKERSSDWFWAFGIIIVTSALASIIYANYFFAGLLILSGILLGFFTKKKPDMVTYELNEKGLIIRNRLYPYENIKSFWVEKNGKPLLFIKSERIFMPILTIPLEDSMTEIIQSIMIEKNIMEERMQIHPSEKIMETLGF